MKQLRERVNESLRLLMQTPATAGWMVWQKLEAFESELSADDEGGASILAESTMLFGCLKADFI